jgi:ribonuclease HI
MNDGRWERVDLYTDGASRGNPGPAAWGYILVQGGEVVERRSGLLGESTNNAAEYEAISRALARAAELGAGRVTVHSDSQLAVRQLRGEWKANASHLSELRDGALGHAARCGSVEFVHEGRGNRLITVADALCNEALDAAGRG